MLVRCPALPLPSHLSLTNGTSSLLTERPLREVYYLWSLAGGDMELELRRAGLIQSKPPICSLPRSV